MMKVHCYWSYVSSIILLLAMQGVAQDVINHGDESSSLKKQITTMLLPHE